MRRLRRRGCRAGVVGLEMGRGRGRGRGRGKGSSVQLRPPSPYRLQLSPSRETLTYAQAQKMVEVDLDGRLHRINITDPLPVITEDEMMAQDIVECNSNKENSEQTQSRARPGRKPPNPKGRRRESKTSSHQSRRSGSQQHTQSHTNSSQHPSHQSPLPEPTFRVLDCPCPLDTPPLPVAYYRFVEKSGEEQDCEAEYDMDEEDLAWLEMVNQKRVSDGHASVSPDTFELLIDRLERESIMESRSQALSQSAMDEDAFCCVCLDDECLNSNVILFCDICNLAVHQECYGVPYIPEGQWLCRCCLQSPSRPVDCVLCPNRGGAFKQTSDGRWAHVVCAIWIPEVCFANTVFLEPVEGVKNIPSARWKLTCYLCKQKGRGASIQCHKANCYRAFHVSCAQKAGLFMKIDPVRETGVNGTTFSVKKTAFCENHSPVGSRRDGSGDEAVEGRLVGGRGNRGQRSYTQSPPAPPSKKTPKGQKKKGKKSLAGQTTRRAAVPVLLVPQIPSHRLNKICIGVAVQRKNQFMQRLHNYWLLKRQSRNGMPLIRRLHSHLQAQKTAEQREPDEKLSAAREELRYWQKLRQDLERARLLVELVRKRERLKREQMKLQQAALELKLTPALILLRSTLDQLQEKDTAQIFSQPVNLAEVPDYLEFISKPMDLSSMRAKLEAHAYCSTADLEGDFNLMVSNCLRYNSKETAFHRAALHLREVGGAVLRHAHRQAQTIGLDPSTGMHLPDSPNKQGFYQCTWEDVDSLLDPDNRLHLSTEEQLKALLDKLDMVASMRSSGGRTKRIRLLRREINTVTHKQQRSLSHNGKEEDEEEEEEGKKDNVENGPLTSASTPGKDDSPPTLEPSCPASSPLPGDAPPEPPVLGLVAAGRRSPGRSYKRQRSSLSGGKGLSDDDAEVGETATPCKQKEDSQKVSPLQTPSPPTNACPLVGVGRRTSVLFKKAKNGARLAKIRAAQLQYVGTNEGKTNGLDSSLTITNPPSESDLSTSTPPPTPSSPSSHRLRSRGPSSDSEGDKPLPLVKVEGKRGQIMMMTSRMCILVGFTNGLGKHQDDSSDLASNDQKHSAPPPPKRSRGKPALAKVPESQNGGSGGSMLLPFDRDTELTPLDLVWAKCRGYPSYPAMVVDPDMPQEGLLHNGIPIPVPPGDVLKLGERRQKETGERHYLVLFFDTKRTWQWLPRDKLLQMGMDDTVDKLRLMEGKKPSVRKSVHTAYDRAMVHLNHVINHVKGNLSFNPSNFI
ncbi:bromodomain and PHD finger-containing protein 3 isoform X5 [Coregonus clupeaformis]|uniref:bromodomain and PHD finger-containing protein 3 isoform X5 n=1 Tax=Coregonus clupeaformis TaxID=59861 RepID=UPI001E1C4F3E|nr:bromodomain and PHD finger-containing protein 3 isoform X5 [Coregonus clupeaformis]